MSMYAVKNDKGEWWDFNDDDDFWPTGECRRLIADGKEEATNVAKNRGGHVVELVEAPAKVVVSEKEAEMLERAKSREEYPAEVIHHYVYDSHNFSEWDYDREIRLMRAYVNGYTVEKPKRWNVKVPHAKTLIYYKFEDVDDLGVAQSDSEGTWVEFTAEEIEQYGLGDCERVEVTDDEQ